MFVKICGLTSAAAVAAAVEAGADAIGFVFAPSPREIAPADAAALCAGVPRTVARVAVMHHPEPERWRRVLAEFTPDWLQTDAEDFTGLELPPGCQPLPVYREGRTPFARRKGDGDRRDVRGAKGATEATEAADVTSAAPGTSALADSGIRRGLGADPDISVRTAALRAALPARIVFEGTVSGAGRATDWDEARALARATELVLAGGLHIGNVAAAIERVEPFGVDVSSGVERTRGEKDTGLIKEFVARVRALEAS